MKKLFVFDLDGTLAASKSSLGSDMAGLLHDLLGVMKVAVISGGTWSQFQEQLLANLPIDERLTDLSLLPTCGTQFYQYVGHWSKIYSEDLSKEERVKIIASLTKAFKDSGNEVKQVWGEVIEDRGSQITLSALGQEAPLKEKEKWDPDFAKRKKIAATLKPLIPEFAINLGGTTSIDITKPGIDKAYGIGKLRDQLNISIPEMLFAGDAIFSGGNDYPAQQAGVDSILVRDPEETARVIQTVLACLGDSATQIKSPGKQS
ncbi:MAG TPA: HAD-IIB family hydrolase [Candidatus Nanopelagicaceae bacterium]|nr:HAD-IIB family hydrolase [Candidatus Nanopelagicaceae bacterium]